MKIFKDGKMSDYIPGGIICVHGLYDGSCDCGDKWKDHPIAPVSNLGDTFKSFEKLQAEAELLFPYPIGACVWVKAKINWKRERWVIEQLNGINVNS